MAEKKPEGGATYYVVNATVMEKLRQIALADVAARVPPNGEGSHAQMELDNNREKFTAQDLHYILTAAEVPNDRVAEVLESCYRT